MLTKEDNELITRTGRGTPMGELFRRFWVPALLAEELPAPDCPPVRVRLLGEDLVAFKDSEGKIGLLDAHCPHRLADLFFGRNEECGLRCVYHGWKFDVEGNCVDMPNEPAESNFKHKIRTTAYPCREHGGIIWAYMGPPDFLPELPELEFTLVPDSHRYIAKYQLDANYLQVLEGDIDNSHVSFLHSYLDTTKSPTGSSGPNYYALDRAPRFTVKDTDYGIMIGARRNADADHYYWHITHWLMPSYSIVGGPKKGQSTICQVRIPRDDESSWLYRVMWNAERPLTDRELLSYKTDGVTFGARVPGTFLPVATAANDYGIDRALQRSFSFTGIKGITDQDQAVTISAGPIADRSKEHLGTSDTAIIATRRKLLRMARELQRDGTIPVAARNGSVYRVHSASALLPRDVPFDAAAKDLVASQV
jgi:nitrite reductase/ring-hydroxylating ferredoxin subunit